VSRARHEVSRFLLEQDVERPTPLLVAVSAGADSMALLDVLVALGQRCAAGHVHHGLRGPSADADERFARDAAASLGVPFLCEWVDAKRPRRGSPEARARELRYAVLESMRVAGGFGHVVTAHTLDDQAETLLLRAIRGTGVDGLASIEPRSRDGRVLRPALGLEREVLRAELGGDASRWREDESNADPGVPRNRLRHSVLPELERIHPGARHRLAALADRAREARLPARAEVEQLLERATRRTDGGFWLDAGPLLESRSDVRMRALARLLSRAGLGERVTAAHLARASDFLATATTGKALSLPGDTALVRARDGFWLRPAPPE
jgi:tRNA(Ile)-lysidine synthase